ncbi:MAG: YigZ family protein [Chitinophagaceae bacterium]|nr:YigZ family protein [Chitinophagaceae bacterium]
MDFYYTIETIATAEFKDRGSKFIANVFPIVTSNDFKNCLRELKKEHPKAAHHCFAYRIGYGENNFRVSDDGEPAATAGKPILGQLDAKQLTNVGVVVVRYFGGTLLGVPGLINAYKTATALVLQVTPVIKKHIEILFQLQFDYTKMNEVMRVVKQFNCTVADQQMQLFCILQIGIPKSRLEEVLYSLNELNGLEIKTV